MQGTDNGAGEHRRWWQSALAAAIEPERRAAGVGRDVRDALPGAAAPYADLVARLGAAQQVATPAGRTSIVPTGDERRARGDIPRVLSAPVLLLSTLLALLAEVGIEDADEFPLGRGHAFIHGTSLEATAVRAVSILHIKAEGGEFLSMSFTDLSRLVRGVIQDLNLQTVLRILQHTHGCHELIQDIRLIKDRQLNGYQRQFREF
jgi:hypothetical protein